RSAAVALRRAAQLQGERNLRPAVRAREAVGPGERGAGQGGGGLAGDLDRELVLGGADLDPVEPRDRDAAWRAREFDADARPDPGPDGDLREGRAAVLHRPVGNRAGRAG